MAVGALAFGGAAGRRVGLAGRRTGLSEPADPHRRAVFARWRCRRTDPGDRPGTRPAAEAADRHRQQAWGGCHHRQRDGGQGGARRLHAAAGLADQCDQRVLVPTPELQSGRRLHRHLDARPRARCAGSAPFAAGEVDRRTGRPREGAARAVELRVLGQWQRPAPLHGDVRGDGWRSIDPRALPRQWSGHLCSPARCRWPSRGRPAWWRTSRPASCVRWR